MGRRSVRAAAIALLCLLGTACSVTRHIPEGSYLLTRVSVETDKEAPRQERITASELEKYIRQSPNKRFLGTYFYVWLYEQADTAKHNRWNNWKRKIGEAPVLLDMNLTERSLQNFKIYLDSKGFYASEASYEVDSTRHPRKSSVTYRIRQGAPYRIDTIAYEFRDRFPEPIILADTARSLIHRGDIFDITRLDAERTRIATYLKERGYYNFSVSSIEYVADTLQGGQRVGVTMVVKPYLAGYNAQGEPIFEDHKVYRIGQVDVFPEYDPAAVRMDSTLLQRLDTTRYEGLRIIYDGKTHLRPAVLRQTIPFYTNYLYNSSQVNRAYSDLIGLGYFKSARIAFTEQPAADSTASYVSYIGAGADSTAGRFTKEGYLQCRILCTPALKQSFKADIEGSTTSSFYGLKATVGYQNRNIFRGAESFDVSFTAGYEFMKAPDARKKTAKEFGVTTSLLFPRFLSPWSASRFHSINQPKTKLEVSVNYQDRPFYRRTLSSASFSYLWSNNRYSSFSLRPIDINVVDVSYLDAQFLEDTENEYLKKSYESQFIGGLNFSYTYNGQLRNLGGNSTLIRFNLETAGNLIDGFEHLFSRPDAGKEYYSIFGLRYAQYFRADLSLSRTIMLGEKVALAGRLYGGVGMAYGNSEGVTIPFDRLFYAGGSGGMRGWTPRTLGPGSVPKPSDTSYPTQLGDMKLEANLELRFPIWGIFHGATFFDLGNIWYVRQTDGSIPDAALFHFDSFYKQLGFNTGLGLRLDIKFVVLRLDWGIQLHNPNNPAGERWIHDFRWKNTALNFGVGYPF